MKKEEKIRILNSSASLLKESAEMLAKAIHTDYEDFTEKDFNVTKCSFLNYTSSVVQYGETFS
jgi:hypothetical protein